MLADRHGNFWLGGSQGIIERCAVGRDPALRARDGLPDLLVRALWEDRDGNIWAGTNGGLARLDGSRFVAPAGERRAASAMWSAACSRTGKATLGGPDNGLTRLRDDLFTVVRQERGTAQRRAERGVSGPRGPHLGGVPRQRADAVSAPAGIVCSRRATGCPPARSSPFARRASGDLLVSTRSGLARMERRPFSHVSRRPIRWARRNVFDALEDSRGTDLAGVPGGTDRAARRTRAHGDPRRAACWPARW